MDVTQEQGGILFINIVPSFFFFLEKKRTDHECGRLFNEGNYPINRQKNTETATVIPTKSHNC